MKTYKLIIALLIFVSFIVYQTGTAGSASTWNVTTSLTFPRYAAKSVYDNGCLFITGGSTGDAWGGITRIVETTKVNIDGTLGTWNAQTPLPYYRSNHTIFTLNGYIYILGGWKGWGDLTGDTIYAKIDSTNCSISEWKNLGLIGTGEMVHAHAMVVNNNYVYVMGGYSYTNSKGWYARNDIFISKIMPDGSLGNWENGTSLTSERGTFDGFAYNKRLYICDTNKIESANINTDGTIGTWQTVLNTSYNLTNTRIIQQDNILYFLAAGGTNEWSPSNTVLTTTINNDGSIEPLKELIPFNQKRANIGTVLANNRIYILGGWKSSTNGEWQNGINLSDVQYLTIPTTRQTLTVTKAGMGTGTLISSPAGINCTTCAANFTSGTSVTLTATPASGSSFMGWSGDCSGTANTCTVSMNAAKNVTATFNITTYILTVNTTGNGTVSSSPAGINHCSGTCTASFTGDAVVTLTATAASGSTFAGWSGGGCSGTGNNCTVTLNANQSVTASFTVTPKSNQSIGAITFNPSSIKVNGTTTVNATASSGLAVTFSSTTPTICTVSGNSVTGKAVGTCKITANQPGNEKYNAAPQMIKNLAVSASQPNRPDIVVTDIKINPATPTAKGVFNVTVTVKNQGTGAGDGGQLALWINQPIYQNCGMDADSKAVIGILATGVSKTLTLNNLLVDNTTGKRTLRVFVDAKCNLVETNEINNQRIKTYTVIPGLRSDLVVKSITITPQSPEANSDFNVKVMIKNQGVIPANSGQVSIWVDAPQSKTCDSINEDQAADLGMLGEGVSTIMNFTLPAGAAGDKVLRVFLDSKCEVAESNENNNQLTKTYTVY